MDRLDYQYFTDNDFYEIIGEHLEEKLSARAVDNSSSYFITYTSTLIKNRIEEMSAKRLFKEDASDGSYELYIGLVKEYAVKLTKEQVSGLILACIYQADYMLENGSTERMSAIGLVNRSNKYSKADLKEFEICSISQNILDNLGLTYMGIGGGVYARIK